MGATVVMKMENERRKRGLMDACCADGLSRCGSIYSTGELVGRGINTLQAKRLNLFLGGKTASRLVAIGQMYVHPFHTTRC